MWQPRRDGITAGIISSHQRCAWRTHWGCEVGYQSRITSGAAHVGTLTHEMIALYHEGREWQRELTDHDTAMATAMTESYIRWARERIYTSVEEPFRVWDEELKTTWRGKMDATLSPGTILDIKTRGSHRPLPDPDVLTHHPQTMIYFRAYRLLWKEPARDMVYLYLDRPAIRPRKGESPTDFYSRARAEVAEPRATIVYPLRDLEARLRVLVEELERDLVLGRQRNTGACESIVGRCEYLELCWRGNPAGLELLGPYPELEEAENDAETQ